MVYPEEAACALEKNVYSILSIPQMSVGANWFTALFKSSISLPIFYLDSLSITAGMVLKSPTIIAEQSISPFSFANVCFIYIGILVFGTYPYVLLRVIFQPHS